MIGDPSGKTSERTAARRREGPATTPPRSGPRSSAFFANDDGPPARVVDNLDWLGEVRLLDFLRDVGKHFAVNQMIQRDSVQGSASSRASSGISYTEFSYMLLQAYDFYELNRRHGCRMQVGASDQWGNIVSGVDLVRRLSGETVYGLTAPLLTDSEGKKYGKSEKGAVFLDGKPHLAVRRSTSSGSTPPTPTWGGSCAGSPCAGEEEIEALEGGARAPSGAPSGRWPRISPAACTATTRSPRCVRASEALFGGGDLRAISGAILEDAALGAAPSITVPRARFDGEGALLVDLLAEVGACPSKSDARRQMAAGAIAVNGVPLADASAETRVTAGDLIDGRLVVLRRGKRNNYVVRVR